MSDIKADLEAIKRRARWCDEDSEPGTSYRSVTRSDRTPFAFKTASCSDEDAYLDRKELLSEIERLQALPEWRPLSVLTLEVAKQWKTWAFKVNDVPVPENRDLSILVLYQDAEIWAESLEIYLSKLIPIPPTVCRPVDGEGIPVPWAKVGL